MPTDTSSDSDGATRTHSNRRRFLKGVGAATVGAVAVTGTASAQQYRFEGCRRVCGDTHADLAVVATDDGFGCRPITEEVDAEAVPWDWQGYCYEAAADETIVGALEEDAWQGRRLYDQWTCKLELNPNACAGEHYDSAFQIKRALEDSEGCGACAGMIVSGDGEGITATDAENVSQDRADGEGESVADDDGGTASEDGPATGTDGDATDDDATDEVEAVTSFADGLRAYISSQFGL